MRSTMREMSETRSKIVAENLGLQNWLVQGYERCLSADCRGCTRMTCSGCSDVTDQAELDIAKKWRQAQTKRNDLKRRLSNVRGYDMWLRFI